MGILDWIDVGKVSAERDNNLTNYFYDNGTLQRLISNQKFFLMLGRKGSGKTALFNYFTENPREFVAAEDIVVPISLDDYSWNVHALLTQNQAADSLSYRQSWRFVLMLEVLKQLSQIQGIGKKVKTAQTL
jgi:uridine kinase